MGHALRALLTLAGLTSVLAAASLAQDDPPDVVPASQPAAQEPKTEPDGPPLGDYKLPDNALVIIADSLAKAQKLIPGGFYVSPAKFREFQELEARVKQLENQLKPKKLKPHKCQLAGQLQGDFLDLEATYVVVTQQPNSLVALGLPGAFLIKADMGGQFPLLQYTTEGFMVQVPNPGNHNLTLHLKLPVKTSREEVLAAGIERTATIGLPGAAVVPPLELKLPTAIKELRWNDLVEKQPAAQGAVNLWKVPLMGDLDKVKLSWKEQAGAAVKGTITSASWDVTVQLLKKQALTTANLTLHDTRGKPTDWRLLVPKGASVEVKGADLSFLPTPEKDFAETALVRIKGPPAQQLEVVVQVAQERQGGKRLAVGPFLVLGADRQQGRFEVQATSDVLQGHRIVYHKHLDLRPLDPSETGPKKNGENVIDRFEAWDLAQGAAALQPASAAKIGAPLELELKTLEAQVETRVEHILRVQPAREGWNLVALTKIHATPLFSVDFLDVKLPAANFPGTLPVLPGPATFTANPADVVAWLAHDPAWPVQPVGEFSAIGEGPAAGAHLLPAPDKDGVHRIDLKKQQTAPFTVTLTRLYKVAPQVRQVRLPLPRPVSLSDKGAKVAVEMEDDRLELVALATRAAQKQKRQISSDWKFAPEAVSVAWQPYQLQLPVTLVADVTLQSRFATVRQEL
jgi:hypothetical protein